MPGKSVGLPPELANPLICCCTVCVSVEDDMVPIIEVAWLALPYLPAQLTTQQLSRETLDSTSLLEWTVVQGGREVPAGLLLQLA